MEKIVGTIGRYRLLHKGHKEYLIGLLNDFDKIIICIGSCFDHGTDKNPLLPIFVEKMLRAMFEEENIDSNRYVITYMADYKNFDEWFSILTNLFDKYNVTHFATGNKEDIVDELEKRNITNLTVIDPEASSTFPYHASDVRNAVKEGNWNFLDKSIPKEIKPLVFSKVITSSIIDANKKEAIPFIPGRQTVDIVFLLRDVIDKKLYVLAGKRSSDKNDFPNMFGLPGGEINLYETSYEAILRSLKEKTNIDIKIVNNTFEPAVISFNNIKNPLIGFLNFSGLYSTDEKKLAGNFGGSSQCFATLIEDDIMKYKEVLESKNELSNVDFYEVNVFLNNNFAYQHKDMIIDAINLLNGNPILKKSKSLILK